MANTGDRTGDAVGGTAELGELDPHGARDPAEYVALLRLLKERSGLTYRQLERRAAERGDVLARSTVADVLRRDALPRAELVAALVRACGVEKGAGKGGPGVDESGWLAARERLASMADEGSTGTPGSDAAAGGGRARGASVAVVASLAAVAVLVVAAVVWWPQGDGPSGAERAGPAHGLSRIRPARAPELCVTDGDARAESGTSKVVAMQRPCAEAVPPKTYLLKADDGLYRIQWDHPQHGPGCLTLLKHGEFKDRFEPWTDCRAGGNSQLFRIEPAGSVEGAEAAGAEGWRLRPVEGESVCVGIRGGAEEVESVAVAEPCVEGAGRAGADAARQVFLIDRG
ncbi:helix-turn-helix domain-containing protein [Streptomyces sp. NPDC012510]|uniref:helix-turn-helix domain-containing protein n=1 Tax=Streptomyces sp. NPDC012510 TaxID=3364838 RepID=UPI0036EC1DF5